MPCVFISHASSDREAVEREIISPLRAHGLDAWYSTHDIQTAYEWERQIYNGLMKCDWFLVALSPRAVNSEWVKFEVHWAFRERKDKIIPVMLETCKPDKLHIGLPLIQHIDFRGGGERARGRLLAVWGLDKEAQVNSLYQAAQDLIAKEGWASAIEKLEALLRLDPAHSQARALLEHLRRQEYLVPLYEGGVTAVREKRWREALKALRQLREADRHYKDVEGLIALAEAELQREGAERLYLDAVEAAEREDWATAVDKFMAVLEITSSHADARAGLDEALRQQELADLYAAGHTHLQSRRWLEALKALRQVRAADRSYKDVSEMIADADAGLAEGVSELTGDADAGLTEEGAQRAELERRMEEARESIERTVQEIKEEARANQKVERVENNKFGPVLKSLTIALCTLLLVLMLGALVIPKFRAAQHYGAAEGLLNEKLYARAESEFREAIKIAPGNASYHNGLGDSLYRQKKYPEAEAEFRKAIELTPNHADYHFNLGLSLESQDRREEAAAEYRRALQIDPNYERAKRSLQVP